MLAACDNDKDIKIIKGMAAIAKELDITMICEGVETEAQVAIMKSVSCNIAQGFYYCQPLRRPQFENLLNLSKIEIVNAERRSINGYGRTVKLPSYRDLGDLFPQMYDFAIELNLKDGRYSRMAFNPTGNVLFRIQVIIKMITSISFRNCFILKILKNLRLSLILTFYLQITIILLIILAANVVSSERMV